MVRTEKSIRVYVMREKPEFWKERGKFSFRVVPPKDIKVRKYETHGPEGYFAYGKQKDWLFTILNEIAKEITKT